VPVIDHPVGYVWRQVGCTFTFQVHRRNAFDAGSEVVKQGVRETGKESWREAGREGGRKEGS
jgi:hypothetical protein